MLKSAKNLFPFDASFWRDPKNWPHDPQDYVFLARAFHEIGHVVFPDAWVELRDDNESDEPEEPDEPDDDCDADTYEKYKLDYDEWERACTQAKIDFENMWSRVSRIIGEACEVGTLVSAVRPKEGGEMINLDAHYWNTEDFAVRFFCCDLSHTTPFSKSQFHRSHWIYVTRDSLDKYLAKKMPAIGVVAQLDGKEDLHQAGSGKASRPQESPARIREELRKIYADPVNDRPNMNKAWRRLHAKLPNARRHSVMVILNEPEFGNRRRGPGRQPKT